MRTARNCAREVKDDHPKGSVIIEVRAFSPVPAPWYGRNGSTELLFVRQSPTVYRDCHDGGLAHKVSLIFNDDGQKVNAARNCNERADN